MHKKRFLFIINGLGLGNSTRCSAIIHELFSSGFEVDVISSSNGLNYFRNSAEVKNLFSFEALLYGKANGKLSIFKTLFMLPKLSMLFIRNCFLLRSVLKKNAYEAIVFDSDYSVASLLWRRRRPLLVGVNNAGVIVEECQNLEKLPRSIRMQFWVEKLDFLFHTLVPDLVICPTLETKDHNIFSRTKFTPPIIRSSLVHRQFQRNEVKNILVMLSGSQFGSDVEFLNKLPSLKSIVINVIGKNSESESAATFYGKVYENHDLITSADMLVINAGFSAISEALVLKKPAVVIPIANHAEQYINALLFEKHGLGLLGTQENADEKILELLSEFLKFKQAHNHFNSPIDGAAIASDLILQALEAKRP